MKKTHHCIALFLVLILCIGLIPVSIAVDADEDIYPVRFDLREYGVVTPVKLQNPWGTCWAFGGIAAAETSILSTLGMTTEEYKAQTGEDFDLSEKHLAWYSVLPITSLTSESQAGEGLNVLAGNDDQDAVYNTGGFNVYVTTLFSSAVGPVPEDAFPYQGAEGLTDAEVKEKYPDRYRAGASSFVTKQVSGMTIDQVLALRKENPESFATVIETLQNLGLLDPGMSGDDLTDEYILDCLVEVYEKSMAAQPLTYSAFDDWTIPDVGKEVPSNRDVYAGYTLVHGNILPSLSIKDSEGKWAAINDAGMRAVKSELLQGRGVSAIFAADVSLPGQSAGADGYMNYETWAHYTHEDVNPNHAVCIVGWDDEYSRENFGEAHQPPADGAWIVKNSWGSETDCTVLPDGTPFGKKAWGVVDDQGRHTGYFYISYYDKSLGGAESMVFDTDLAELGGELHVQAYDFMPSSFSGMNMQMKAQEKDVIKTANVFSNNSDKKLALCGVSTKAGSPRARVQYSIYRLNENAETPEDGELLDSFWSFYEYAGFHREKLNGGITFEPGERFSVVVTESVTDKNGEKLYECSTNQAPSEELAVIKKSKTYGTPVVNKGESFIYTDGKWTDWSEFELPLPEDFSEYSFTEDPIATDNFSIKAYLVYRQETGTQE